MMSRMPLVTMVTVTYNGQRFLGETITSVLRQSFTDFEYLIVDNASTDHSRQIAATYAAQDARIRIIDSATNLGPAGGLNLALRAARGRYFANLDHDDIAALHRLAVQVPRLEAEPALGIVGGWMRAIDESGAVLYTYEYRQDHADIHWHLMTHCGVIHSAATMRRSVLLAAGGYSPHHHFICDYELFSRLRDQTQFANVPDYLVGYRSFTHQASQRYRRAQHLQVLMLWHALYADITGAPLTLDRWHNFYRAWHGAPLDQAHALHDAAAVATAIGDGYLARYQPAQTTAAIVKRDCAIWLLTMAHRHRRILPTPARSLYAKALDLTPNLWQHGAARQALRTARRLLRQGSADTLDSGMLPLGDAALHRP